MRLSYQPMCVYKDNTISISILENLFSSYILLSFNYNALYMLSKAAFVCLLAFLRALFMHNERWSWWKSSERRKAANTIIVSCKQFMAFFFSFTRSASLSSLQTNLRFFVFWWTQKKILLLFPWLIFAIILLIFAYMRTKELMNYFISLSLSLTVDRAASFTSRLEMRLWSRKMTSERSEKKVNNHLKEMREKRLTVKIPQNSI